MYFEILPPFFPPVSHFMLITKMTQNNLLLCINFNEILKKIYMAGLLLLLVISPHLQFLLINPQSAPDRITEKKKWYTHQNRDDCHTTCMVITAFQFGEAISDSNKERTKY